MPNSLRPNKKRKKDRLSSALQDLPTLLEQREHELADREAALEQERLAWEAEKAQFTTAAGGGGGASAAAASSSSETDVLPLNVGGTRMDVLRRTLTSIEGSMLAARFSGRWDDSLERDKEGNFFLDQSPALFEQLVNILRDRSNEMPGAPSLKPPDVHNNSTTFFHNNKATYEAFCRMVQYFGCTHAIWPCRIKYKHPVQSSNSNNSNASAGYLCPRTFYPNVIVAAPATTNLFWQVSPSHHTRQVRTMEFVVLQDHQDNENLSFGWTFRTTAAAQQGAGTATADQQYVLVNLRRGMLQLNAQDVVRINDGLPLTLDCGSTIRLAVKRSVFYFQVNGTTIASCAAFRSRSIKKQTPVVAGNGRWRITECVLDT